METTERTLTGEAVSKLFISLLFKEGEATDNHVPAEGIVKKVGFHPERLEAARGQVKAMLDELPDEFRQSKGGGWSFLNMCYDRHEMQWTGFHDVQEQLCLMGIALGLVEFHMPRDMWPIFPGGVPYLVYKDVTHD